MLIIFLARRNTHNASMRSTNNPVERGAREQLDHSVSSADSFPLFPPSIVWFCRVTPAITTHTAVDRDCFGGVSAYAECVSLIIFFNFPLWFEGCALSRRRQRRRRGKSRRHEIMRGELNSCHEPCLSGKSSPVSENHSNFAHVVKDA